MAVRDRGRADLRHHTAFFRRDLGRRREAARRADARSLSRAHRLSKRGARHLQHARHRRYRRSCSRRLLYRDRACRASVELRLDAACRLSGDGAACHAGPRRRPCPAMGIPVRAVPFAAQVDDGLDLARLFHCLARLRHAAHLRHLAAGRAGAGGSRAHSRRNRPARQARCYRAADQIRHAGQLAAGVPDFRARILYRHLPAWPRHRGDRFASGVALGYRRSRSGVGAVSR